MTRAAKPQRSQFFQRQSKTLLQTFDFQCELVNILNRCTWFSGKVSILEESALDSFNSEISRQAADRSDASMKLNAHEIYKELRLRGYDYGKTFQGILESNTAGTLEGHHSNYSQVNVGRTVFLII